MDFVAHRQRMLEHCLQMKAMDPDYAARAIERYAKLPHLQGFAQEVAAAWLLQTTPEPPTTGEPE